MSPPTQAEDAPTNIPPREDPANEEGEEEEEALDMFAEPADYYPPSPKPTTTTYTLREPGSDGKPRTLQLRLVGHNPLWGHHLWNGARLISAHIESHPELVRDKTVLELGAGAGLPSLVSAAVGAKTVVVSDYPDVDLVKNLQVNIDENVSVVREGKVAVEGYCWGADVSPLLSHLGHNHPDSQGAGIQPGFDVLILADLLFNHSEHVKLVETIKRTLGHTSDARALVFFTPYRPWLFEKDMAFFDLAKEAGFTVEKILEEKMEKVMFENDPGDEELRRTVFGFDVKWAATSHASKSDSH